MYCVGWPNLITAIKITPVHPRPIQAVLTFPNLIISELNLHVQEYLPRDYQRRRRTDGRGRYMNHPLPSVSEDPPLARVMQVMPGH